MSINLVTGFGGFIGSQVCFSLADHGSDVVVVDQSFYQKQ